MSVVVIIGPSGAGKSSVASILQAKHQFQLVKTVTTRKQRDAFDTGHTFVSPQKFKTYLDEQAFFGTLSIFGHHYGLPKFKPNQETLLLLRAPAIEEFLTKFPTAIIVEIDAPIKELEKRLRKRGSEDRIHQEELSKEISWGQLLADIAFDSSIQTPEEIAHEIAVFIKVFKKA